jgi:hypothetical protein
VHPAVGDFSVAVDSATANGRCALKARAAHVEDLQAVVEDSPEGSALARSQPAPAQSNSAGGKNARYGRWEPRSLSASRRRATRPGKLGSAPQPFAGSAPPGSCHASVGRRLSVPGS